MNTFRFQRTKLLKVSLVAVAAMLAVCLLALVVRVEPSQATLPGQNGKIAFVSTRDGNTAIYTMYPDGSDLTQLTNTASDLGPVWSPDGIKIAFQGDGGIWTMNAEGSNLTNISAGGGFAPDWQPLPGPTVPKTKAECKKGGYKEFGFKNQGRCIALVNRATRSE